MYTYLYIHICMYIPRAQGDGQRRAGSASLSVGRPASQLVEQPVPEAGQPGSRAVRQRR